MKLKGRELFITPVSVKKGDIIHISPTATFELGMSKKLPYRVVKVTRNKKIIYRER